jgi:riboflavin biosynthesis pyrimidine reductase
MDPMRALIPPSHPGLNVDVHEFFGTDWLDGGGLRVNFVASVDGAVAVAGLSRGLQTTGDNEIFAALRDLADVVLVGAGTARAEGYRAVRPTGQRRQRRLAAGLSDQLPVAVVSRTLRLDPAAELFSAASGPARTIVLTCQAADPSKLTALRKVADVVVCGEQDVDLSLARAELVSRGLSRILCEGGPTLFGDLALSGNVDELCLSVSPLLAGPGSGRVTGGLPWPVGARPLQLIGLLEEESALFCRYRVL